MEIVFYLHACLTLIAYVSITDPEEPKWKSLAFAFVWPVVVGILVHDFYDFLERDRVAKEKAK